MRDLVAVAKSRDWSLDTVLASSSVPAVAEAIAVAEHALIPLNQLEPVRRNADGKWDGECGKVRNWLKPFGMVIAPGMAPEARTNWLNAMVLSLSDLPPNIVQLAIQDVLHKPLSFLNEVHGEVRASATRLIALQRVALERLRDAEAALHRGQPLALPSQAKDAPLSEHEIAKMPGWLRALGVAAGGIDTEAAAAAPEYVEPQVPAPSPRAQVAPPPVSATLQDYLSLGLTEDEAKAAMAERERLLARGRPAKAIGDTKPNFGTMAA